MQNNCACLADCAYNSSDRSNKKTPVTDDITGVFYDEKMQAAVFCFCTALPSFDYFYQRARGLNPSPAPGLCCCLLEQCQHALGLLVGLGQHGRGGLLDDLGFSQGGGCHSIVGVFDPAA